MKDMPEPESEAIQKQHFTEHLIQKNPKNKHYMLLGRLACSFQGGVTPHHFTINSAG